LRFKKFNDLLAQYETDTNLTTKQLSAKKVASVWITIRYEKCRLMYSNIRSEVRPTTALTGLQKLLIPQHRDRSQYPINFHHAIETMDPEDIIWDKVLDKETLKEPTPI
jgi:hypothetical protein